MDSTVPILDPHAWLSPTVALALLGALVTIIGAYLRLYIGSVKNELVDAMRAEMATKADLEVVHQELRAMRHARDAWLREGMARIERE